MKSDIFDIYFKYQLHSKDKNSGTAIINTLPLTCLFFLFFLLHIYPQPIFRNFDVLMAFDVWRLYINMGEIFSSFQ